MKDTIVEDVKIALKRMAKSVTLVAAKIGETRMVTAATAVSNLSDDPPSLLVCMESSASLYGALASRCNFSLNLLGADQSAILMQCLRSKGADRFGTDEWCEGGGGVPYLACAQASFVCETDAVFEYATHGIFVGRIRSVACSGILDPMLYVDGRFGRIADQYLNEIP